MIPGGSEAPAEPADPPVERSVPTVTVTTDPDVVGLVLGWGMMVAMAAVTPDRTIFMLVTNITAVALAARVPTFSRTPRQN